ncbi:MAG: hypothetical protein ACLP8S_16205 [Solirubrobacteraceae bacterium]
MSLKLERYDLAQHGDVLATRSTGRDVGRAVAERLAESPGLIVSFNGVDVASPAFLFELIGAIRAALIVPPTRWLLVTGMNDDVRESAELVLERLKMVLGQLENDQIELLGGARHLQDTIRAAQKLGAFTAPDLAAELELKLPALHQRLVQLVEAGVLSREDDPTATRGKRSKFTTPPDANDAMSARQDTGDFAAITVNG